MQYAEQSAEGSSLALWSYQDNIMKLKRSETPKLELYDSSENDAWTRGLFKADAQNLARTLCDAPSNQITPTAFAQVIQIW
jgi:cytosol aminopeptidase